jgi:2,3-bisphosphoglycerate-dependent phosphoglycerate mutase
MYNLILVRHGQSQWNLENRFTGWYDAELTKQGVEEAQQAGTLIKNLNINFNFAFTSFQKRAILTLDEINKKLDIKAFLKIRFIFECLLPSWLLK